MKLPTSWEDALGDAPEAQLSRAFHRPTNLADNARVVLRVSSPQRIVRVLVNGSEQTDGCDLSPLLGQSNHLTLTLGCVDASADILEAHLEIHDR